MQQHNSACTVRADGRESIRYSCSGDYDGCDPHRSTHEEGTTVEGRGQGGGQGGGACVALGLGRLLSSVEAFRIASSRRWPSTRAYARIAFPPAGARAPAPPARPALFSPPLHYYHENLEPWGSLSPHARIRCTRVSERRLTLVDVVSKQPCLLRFASWDSFCSPDFKAGPRGSGLGFWIGYPRGVCAIGYPLLTACRSFLSVTLSDTLSWQ